MAKTGRGNKAIDTLPPDVRGRVDALLDLGQSPTHLYVDGGLGLDQYLEASTFLGYARDRRRERQIQIAQDERVLMDGLLELAEIDPTGLSGEQKILLGTTLKGMMLSAKPTSRLNAVLALLQIRKDQRKQEEHELRIRIGRVKLELQQREQTARKKGGKEAAGIYAEIAKMMEQIEVGDQAA
jgi:hypothetical protein